MRVSGRMTGAAQVVSAIAQIPSLLSQGAERAMHESLQIVSTVARGTYLSGPYPTRLQPRTGRLRASLRRGDRENIWQVRRQGTTITGELGTSTVYARIHEEGGVIRPVRGRYLAIPTAFAMTSSGVLKREYQGGLRQIPHTFFIRSRTGGLSLWQRTAARRVRGAKLSSVAKPLFWLVRQVRLPKRPFLRPAVEQSRPQITERFQVMVNTVITRANETIRKIRGAA